MSMIFGHGVGHGVDVSLVFVFPFSFSLFTYGAQTARGLAKTPHPFLKGFRPKKNFLHRNPTQKTFWQGPRCKKTNFIFNASAL